MFEAFPKMGRLYREIVVTEKIDGTNAQVLIEHKEAMEDPGIQGHRIAEIDGYYIFAGSRTRFITPADDNFGFANWVENNAPELVYGLGIGRHFGEWWGKGIQRGYGLDYKKFSLFNTSRWKDNAPKCCDVVPGYVS